MERKSLLLVIALVFVLNFTFLSAEEFGYNLIKPPPFNNNTAFVNSSSNWVTTTLGILSDVNATQFNNNAGTLTIDESWLSLFIGGGEPLWTENFTLYNSTWTSTFNTTYDAYNSTGLIINWSDSGFVESDPKAYNGTLAYLSDLLSWGYYNSTDFSIADYYLKSNPFSFWNDTFATFNESFADTLYLQLDGSNANQNIDIGIYNFSASFFFGNINANFVRIALGSGSPTIDQLQEYLDNTGSSGFFIGGELSDGGSGTLDVASGEGFIRTTSDDNAPLLSFKWSASSGIDVPDNTTQYVYVDDEGVISLSTDEFLEAPDKIQIGVVTDEGGSAIHEFQLGVRLEESIGAAGRFIRRVHGISRNNRLGGLIFGQSSDANRDVTMTSGQLEWGRTTYVITSFDTSGADTFSTYSASGQENASASQWDNDNYDNSGTLTSMGNNKWANLFFFLEPDDHIVMIYGRDQFTSQARAENEGVPSSSLPSKVTETSILVARFVFKKGDNTAVISSAFDALFANAGVTDHGNLAGLTDVIDHPYALLIDGSRELTSLWNYGSFGINGSGNFTTTDTGGFENIKTNYISAQSGTTITINNNLKLNDNPILFDDLSNIQLGTDGTATLLRWRYQGGIFLTFDASTGDITFTGDILGGGAGHDQFSDFVVDEHIDWTDASDDFLTAGGGTLASVNIIDEVVGYKIDGTTIISLKSPVDTNGIRNLFIGTNTGTATTSGDNNLFIGEDAGKLNTEGFNNLLLGLRAGDAITTGGFNVAIGVDAAGAITTASSNMAIGSSALKNIIGIENVAIGVSALQGAGAGTAEKNVAIGTSALQSVTTGDFNTAIGRSAGEDITTAGRNVFIGGSSGLNTLSSDNVMIGYRTGVNAVGARNVFLGIRSGIDETGSDTFLLNNRDAGNEQQNRDDALMYGLFGSHSNGPRLTINGDVGIGTSLPRYPLEVSGFNATDQSISIFAEKNISATGFITRTSVFNSLLNAFDYIKNSTYYLNEGVVDHSKFYGYSVWEVQDLTRPIESVEVVTICEDFYDDEGNLINEICNDETYMITTYPYMIEESGVELGKEIDVLRQGLFELKEENDLLNQKIESIESCVTSAKDFFDYQTCVGGIGMGS